MHNPAEQDMLKSGTVNEIIQQMCDIIQNHGLGFLGNGKGVHIPTPIAVQENTARQQSAELLANGGFTDAHCAIDTYDRFHRAPPFKQHESV